MDRRLVKRGMDHLLQKIYGEDWRSPHLFAHVAIVKQDQDYAKLMHEGIALHMYKDQKLDVDYRSAVMAAEELAVYDAHTFEDGLQCIMVEENNLVMYDEEA